MQKLIIIVISTILSLSVSSATGQATKGDCVNVEDIDLTLIDNLDGNLVKPCDNNSWIQLSSIRPDIYGGPRIRENIGGASTYYYFSRTAIFFISDLEDKDTGGKYYFMASLSAELNQIGFEEKAAIYALLYMENVDEFDDQHFSHILSSYGLEEIDLNCFAIWDDPSIEFGRIIQSSAYQSCKGIK